MEDHQPRDKSASVGLGLFVAGDQERGHITGSGVVQAFFQNSHPGFLNKEVQTGRQDLVTKVVDLFFRWHRSGLSIGLIACFFVHYDGLGKKLDGCFSHAFGVVVGIGGHAGRTQDWNPSRETSADGFLGDLDSDFFEELLKGSERYSAHQDSLSGPNNQIAGQKSGSMPEEAVEHHLAGEHSAFSKAVGDVGNELLLKSPNSHEVRQNGEHPHRPGRNRECSGYGSRLEAGCLFELMCPLERSL